MFGLESLGVQLSSTSGWFKALSSIFFKLLCEHHWTPVERLTLLTDRLVYLAYPVSKKIRPIWWALTVVRSESANGTRTAYRLTKHVSMPTKRKASGGRDYQVSRQLRGKLAYPQVNVLIFLKTHSLRFTMQQAIKNVVSAYKHAERKGGQQSLTPLVLRWRKPWIPSREVVVSGPKDIIRPHRKWTIEWGPSLSVDRCIALR